MEQLDSQLSAADVTLDAALLDRIDEIVRPGVNLNPADTATAKRYSRRPIGGGKQHAPGRVAATGGRRPPKYS